MNGSNGKAHSTGARARGRLLSLILLLAAIGCEESPGPLPDRVPPITYLSVQGADLDTMDYRQVLHWWGTDPDGQVAGYYIRWDGGWVAPAEWPRWSEDTTWVYTTATTDTFAVPIGGTFASRTFCVRAVDEDGLVDPNGRCQQFQLENQLPLLSWTRAFSRPDTSLPAAPFAWHPVDHDGFLTVRRYLFWLEPDPPQAEAIVDTFEVRDTIMVVTPGHLASSGLPTAGDWLLSVQAEDEAGGRSNIIRHRWTVREPRGRYLLIDNAPDYVPGYVTEDNYYRAILEDVAPADYDVVDMQSSGGFKTPVEIYPLFHLFRGVVWYGGTQNDQNDAVLVRNLQRAEPGIRRYLEDDGRFLIVAANAVGDTAGFSEDFVEEMLSPSELFRADERTDIPLERGSILFTDLGGGQDSLVTTSKTLRADFIRIAPEAIRCDGLFWVRPGFLNQAVQDPVEPDPTSEPAYLGVSIDQGRFTVVTFLLSRANGLGNGHRTGADLLRETIAR